jgi:hypothetical protein
MRKFLSLKILAIGRLERARERDTAREEREKKRGEMDGCCCAAKMDGWVFFVVVHFKPGHI